MQSAFTIRNLDSNSEPLTNMAAAVPDKRDFGSVITACHEHLQSRMITTLYALNAESRYVTGKLLGIMRFWPITKPKAFVNYNNRLDMKRESKQR